MLDDFEKTEQIVCINANGLTTSITRLQILIERTKPDIVFLSETHLTIEINNCEIEINNYVCVRCDSISRHTGGVAIYVKQSIGFSVFYSEVLDKLNTWFLTIKVTNGFKKGLYSVLYHSPNSNDNIFLDCFERILEQVLVNDQNNIKVGDFNINMIQNNTTKD